MELRAALLRGHSKEQALKITTYIGKDPQRFGQLIALMLHAPYRLAQRASWVAMHCVAIHPELLHPHLTVLTEHLGRSVSDTVKRNILRMMQDTPLPEALWGTLTHLCFEFLIDRRSAIAVKVFAMTVLGQITEQVPELAEELKWVIEDQLAGGSPAFVSRAKKVLKTLEKSKKYCTKLQG